MSITVACPAGYEPNATVLMEAEKTSRAAGGNIGVSHDPLEAAKDADLLYTDVWVSMGDEASKEKRMKDFSGYQINDGLLKVAKKDVSVMQCLPAHRGLEITDDVIDGRQSIV